METPNTTPATPAITLSDAALKEVKRLINVQGLTEGGLRVGVKGGGCSGFSYTLGFDDQIAEVDQVTELEGIRIVCDPKSFLYLNGTQIDFEDNLMGRGFKFGNPNAAKSCGCGESFSV
jgi:iron-sulfur cluster assembly protein